MEVFWHGRKNMAMQRRIDYSYEEWKRSADKDDDRYYKNAELRCEYAKEETLRKAKNLKRVLKKEFKKFVQENSDADSLTVLDLCCGSGTASIAVRRLVGDFGWRSFRSLKRIEFIGVDKNDWSNLDNGCAAYLAQGPRVKLQFHNYYGYSIDEYLDSLQRSPPAFKFDLIIGNYMSLGEYEIIGDFKQFLSDRGRVFVNDNNSRKVTALNGIGFYQADLSRLGDATPQASVLMVYRHGNGNSNGIAPPK